MAPQQLLPWFGFCTSRLDLGDGLDRRSLSWGSLGAGLDFDDDLGTNLDLEDVLAPVLSCLDTWYRRLGYDTLLRGAMAMLMIFFKGFAHIFVHTFCAYLHTYEHSCTHFAHIYTHNAHICTKLSKLFTYLHTFAQICVEKPIFCLVIFQICALGSYTPNLVRCLISTLYAPITSLMSHGMFKLQKC